MSRVLLGLSRFLCAVTVLASPWLLSGRPLIIQAGMASALGLAWCLWILGRLFAARNPSAGWSASTAGLVLIWCGVIAVAVVQLYLPLDAGLPARHAVVERLASNFSWPEMDVETGSQVPSLTRLQMVRYLWPLVALTLGAELFSEPALRRGLWLLLGLNGAALTLFGIVQRLTWNGQLYWLIPQPSQGQPFASFWNRNHAAGYLNLCLAAAVGLLAAGLREAPEEWWPARSAIHRQTFRALFVQFLLLIIPAGVIASISRGGIIASATAAALLIVLCLSLRATALARYFMISLIAGAVLASGLGMWQLAQSRFDDFDLQTALEDGRWRHWQDMLPALQDAWHSGTGMGTYRYANRPYQNHALPTKYWNADNEYLELVVEGGMPIVGLFLIAVVILAVFLRQTWRADNIDDEDLNDIGPVSLLVLVTQGLQAFTDYGVSVPSNALTIALILGALTGSYGWRAPSPDAFGVIPSQRLSWQWGPVLALSLCAFVSWREIQSAATVSVYHQSLPAVENPKAADWTSLEADAAIGRVEQFLQERPDDFQLHRLLAQLHILRYRQELLATMQDPRNIAVPLDAEVAWSRTHPSAWDALARQWVRTGNVAALQSMRDDPVFRAHLPLAYAELQRSRELCPFDPSTDLLLGLLAYPCGNGRQDRDRWLRNAVRAAPADPKFLREIAVLTEPIIQDDLAAFCWRRAIALDATLQDVIFREAAERLAPGYVLEHVVEPNAASLLRFAEVIEDPLIREMAVQKLTSLLKDGTVASHGETWVQLARLALLQGNQSEASDSLKEAVRLEPLRWEYRLKYAETLLANGENEAALEQAQAGLRVSPEQPRLQSLKQKLTEPERRRKKP